MSKKQLDTAAIASELRGQSAFFPARTDERTALAPVTVSSPATEPFPPSASAGYASEQQVFPPNHRTGDSTTLPPAAAEAGRADVPPFGSPPVPSVSPSVERPSVRPSYPIGSLAPTLPLPHMRTITRYAFEFYQDQIETLRALSLEQKFAGQKGSMSEMVRDALDAYIAQLKRAQG